VRGIAAIAASDSSAKRGPSAEYAQHAPQAWQGEGSEPCFASRVAAVTELSLHRVVRRAVYSIEVGIPSTFSITVPRGRVDIARRASALQPKVTMRQFQALRFHIATRCGRALIYFSQVVASCHEYATEL
jgi:hypothetical protein